MITEENTLLFQKKFYVRLRWNVANLTAGSVGKKIFTAAMEKLARERVDLNILLEEVK